MLLTDNEKNTIEILTITGQINAYDISILRYNMPQLSSIDLRGVNINSFAGIIQSSDVYSPANTLPKEAFYFKSSLKKILLPNSIYSIGERAFNNCLNLSDIYFPQSVYQINSEAFNGTAWLNNQLDGLVYAGSVLYVYKGIMPTNSNVEIKDGTLGIAAGAFSKRPELNSIILPNSIYSIGGNAFYSCSNLISINFPNSLTEIDYDALAGTGWLNNQSDGLVYAGNVLYKYKGEMPLDTKIELKSGTVSISYRAFANLKGLSSIYLPNTVKYIGALAFRGCEGLTSLIIPNSVITISNGAFSYCTMLNSISIPNSVINIKLGAFYECTGLSSISIPNSVTEIESNAFYGLSRLKTVYSYLENPMYLDVKHFEKTNNAYCTLYVPKGKTTKYIQTKGWNYFLNIVEFDATLLNTPENSTIKVNYNPYNKTIVVNGVESVCDVTIFNLDGRICSPVKSINLSEKVCVNFLNKGIYIVKAKINNEIIAQKIHVF